MGDIKVIRNCPARTGPIGGPTNPSIQDLADALKEVCEQLAALTKWVCEIGEVLDHYDKKDELILVPEDEGTGESV